MFVPYTINSGLAKELREAEEMLFKLTGYKLKIVERSGTTLEELLHKSDPWQGIDCERQGCILCATKLKTGKNLGQDCHKRSVVYETNCLTCEERKNKEIEESCGDDKEKAEEMKRKQKRHIYVGETARSCFERLNEHESDKRQLKTTSHMLRHLVGHHEGEDMDKVEFGVKILKVTKTSFERQILESVLIQDKRGEHLMNLKSEYNRCAIPKLVSKLGEKDLDKWRKEDMEEQKKEETIERKIRMMRKERNKERQDENRDMDDEMPPPPAKRKRVEEREEKDEKKLVEIERKLREKAIVEKQRKIFESFFRGGENKLTEEPTSKKESTCTTSQHLPCMQKQAPAQPPACPHPPQNPPGTNAHHNSGPREPGVNKVPVRTPCQLQSNTAPGMNTQPNSGPREPGVNKIPVRTPANNLRHTDLPEGITTTPTPTNMHQDKCVEVTKNPSVAKLSDQTARTSVHQYVNEVTNLSVGDMTQMRPGLSLADLKVPSPSLSETPDTGLDDLRLRLSIDDQGSQEMHEEMVLPNHMAEPCTPSVARLREGETAEIGDPMKPRTGLSETSLAGTRSSLSEAEYWPTSFTSWTGKSAQIQEPSFLPAVLVNISTSWTGKSAQMGDKSQCPFDDLWLEEITSIECDMLELQILRDIERCKARSSGLEIVDEMVKQMLDEA